MSALRRVCGDALSFRDALAAVGSEGRHLPDSPHCSHSNPYAYDCDGYCYASMLRKRDSSRAEPLGWPACQCDETSSSLGALSSVAAVLAGKRFAENAKGDRLFSYYLQSDQGGGHHCWLEEVYMPFGFISKLCSENIPENIFGGPSGPSLQQSGTNVGCCGSQSKSVCNSSDGKMNIQKVLQSDSCA
eukprot:5370659-Amphidinium_carterae.1